jgi:hypothetical protein
MRRRDFITLLGGALADQAIPANAQELRVRTVGVLTAWNDVTVAFLGSHERIGSTTLSHWEAAWGGNCLKTSALCRMETRRRAYASRKS